MKSWNGYFSKVVGIIKLFGNKRQKLPEATEALCISHTKIWHNRAWLSTGPLLEKRWELQSIFVIYYMFYYTQRKSKSNVMNSGKKKKELKGNNNWQVFYCWNFLTKESTNWYTSGHWTDVIMLTRQFDTK